MFSLLDIGIGVLALLLVFVALFALRIMKNDELYDSYFIKGFSFKILGVLSFILVYYFIYGGLGDSYRYYLSAELFLNQILEYPADTLELFFGSKEQLNIYFTESELRQLGRGEDFLFVKIVSVLMFVCFKNYLLMSVFMALFTFYGSWKLFTVLSKKYDAYKRHIFIAIFLLPSVFFWSSCLMKDSFVMSIFLLFIYQLLSFKRSIFLIGQLFVTLFLIYLLTQMKAYVIISFVPALTLFIYSSIRKQSESKIVRNVLAPLILVGLLGASLPGALYIGQVSEKYQLEDLEARTKGFHTWHSTLGGSAYDLGTIDYTVPGVLSKAPEAISITLIRPFPYEIKNAMMLIGGLESLFFLGLIIFVVVFKIGPFKWIKSIWKDPFLFSSWVFVVVFAFAVGFTSYNYGALFRYKIPCMPFYYLIIIIPYLKYKKDKLLNDSVS